MEISHAYITRSWDDAGKARRKAEATKIDVVVSRTHAFEAISPENRRRWAELEVLRGAKQTLEKSSLVIIEATMAQLAARLNALVALGFDLFDIVDLCFYDDTLYQVDLVFINRRIKGTLEMPDIRQFEPMKWVNYLHGKA